MKILLFISLLACVLGVTLSACRSAGTSQDGTTIRIIGDSLLAGNGIQSAMASALNTEVVNCAVSGASTTEISNQDACSQRNDCPIWSIVSGGRNGPGEDYETTLEGMTDIVNRERNAGKKVIIFLYSPDALSHNDPNSWVNTFQNEYYALVDGDNVQIYDPRLDPRLDYGDPNSRQYRSEDDSHPSELGRQLMGAAVSQLIDGSITGEPTPAPQPTAPTTPQICSGECSAEFTTVCIPYHCQAATANPYQQCRNELDSQIGPIANACNNEAGCIDTEEMATLKDNPCGEEESICDGVTQWKAKKTYAAGSIVYHKFAIYEAKDANKNADPSKKKNKEKWRKTVSKLIKKKENYKKGDNVIFKNKIYQSLQDSNAGKRVKNTKFWKLYKENAKRCSD